MVDMPTWDQLMAPMLRVLSDGQVRRLRELRDRVASEALTAEQLTETLPSGDSKSDNRIGWAASYFSRVGAIERPARGQYVITDLGRTLLADNPSGINERDLRQLAREGDEWWLSKAVSSNSAKPEEAPILALDPVEQVEDGIGRIHADVIAELLDRRHSQQPAFFEQAVLDLLIAMGYGGAEGHATRTQLSNDGGIDGIVDQDALGLSRIYVQAKRYALDSAVGRPEIQAFVGALHGNQANQGVFITTGRFSDGARTYADAVPSRVILIDGQRLAALMIRYGVGVQVSRTLHIVELDEDFFE
ncbi:restriction endonuclease [soil metagenome]